MKEIVEYPDYLIETNKSNTALVLKEIIAVNNKVFKVVVRLNTSTDNPQYKNSIITSSFSTPLPDRKSVV